MPQPITPGAKFARELIHWNTNRGDNPPVIEGDFGLNPITDDEMIQHILHALLSEKGLGVYKSKKALKKKKPATPTPFPTATPPPGALGVGVGTINGPSRNDLLEEQKRRLGI